MTKEQERAELHRAIRQIANDPRGSVDGWDFKQTEKPTFPFVLKTRMYG